jgi:hypothetical protein
MKHTTILALLFVLGCTTAANQQTAANAQQNAKPSEFKNLQVLPRDISHDELIGVMRTFTRSLGQRCDYCHVVTATEPKQVFDFPSDAKEEKRIARVMMQMTSQINGTWLPRVDVAEGHPAPAAGQARDAQVSCWTCHRGKAQPEPMPPPPPPPAAPSAAH